MIKEVMFGNKKMNSTNGETIGVICAHNPRNSGMYCVDLAAKHYFSTLNTPFDLLLTQGRDRIGGLRYRMVGSPEDLRRYSTIVYWGDFLNNPMWGQRDYPGRNNAHGNPSTEQEWAELYLGIKNHLPDARVIVAGGCALGARSHIKDAELHSNYLQFLRTADAVILRDSASIAEINSIYNDNSNLHLGFDCASILREFKNDQARGRYFAYSFHRSLTSSESDQLVRSVERQTGLKGMPVNWLRNEWPRPIYHWRLASQLGLMRHARFCITDIYHFSICAMTQGTPTVCISKPEETVDHTLNESKKRVLFDMIKLPDFHILWNNHWQDKLHHALHNVHPKSDLSASWSHGFCAAQRQLREQLNSLLKPHQIIAEGS